MDEQMSKLVNDRTRLYTDANRLHLTIVDLLVAMGAMREDLIRRGERGGPDEALTVDVSDSVWLQFNEAITNAKQVMGE